MSNESLRFRTCGAAFFDSVRFSFLSLVAMNESIGLEYFLLSSGFRVGFLGVMNAQWPWYSAPFRIHWWRVFFCFSFRSLWKCGGGMTFSESLVMSLL